MAEQGNDEALSKLGGAVFKAECLAVVGHCRGSTIGGQDGSFAVIAGCQERALFVVVAL